MKEEIFREKAATNTLNVLYLTNLLHLCGNNPSARISQFIVTHKVSRRFLIK